MSFNIYINGEYNKTLLYFCTLVPKAADTSKMKVPDHLLLSKIL